MLQVAYIEPETGSADILYQEYREMEKTKIVIINIRKCPREEVKEFYVRSQEVEKPKVVLRRKSPPKDYRPKIKLNLAPPPELPPPVQRVKVVLPEMPRMKIKFSTCTALYKPAQPAYEGYKKISVPKHHRHSMA